MSLLPAHESCEPFVPLEEYLRTSYEPDCDYVDGRIEERNVGILNQQIVITAMMVAMHNKRGEWRAQVLPSLREHFVKHPE